MPTVSVILCEEKKDIEFETEDTLYNICDLAKVELPHGCLAGSCSSCRVEVIAGTENLKAASIIEQDTIDSLLKNHPEWKDKNVRLSCRAKASGDVTMKPLK